MLPRPIPGTLHVARLVDPGRDHQRIVLRAQLGERAVAPDLDVQVNLHAAFGEQVGAAPDDLDFSSLKLGIP